uniref:Evolutionarily conserved signaling intermediate in Toll pathway, mitochondrial n=1 Tax=Panagrellus redivivus TaxID=6233 RepID=A0A7E4UMQ0_PANRE
MACPIHSIICVVLRRFQQHQEQEQTCLSPVPFEEVISAMLRQIWQGQSKSLQRLFPSCNAPLNRPMSSKDPQLLHIDEQFRKIPKEDRNKATFNTAIELFQHNRMRTRGHVEFLNTALKYLEEYNLHKDLDTYKSLLKVFPKGPLIPTNVFQKMFLHFPMQQQCCVKILDMMEWHGVQPDKEVHDIVANTFGEWNFATRKIKRMLYWMPKLRYSNKYLDRRMVENKNLDDKALAKVALKMMCRDPGTTFTLVKTPSDDAEAENSWVVSAQAPLQKKLITDLAPESTIYVDGPNVVYLLEKPIKYFVLSSDPFNTNFDEFIEQRDIYDMKDFRGKVFSDRTDLTERNLHQQSDKTILAMAVFEYQTESMAVRWLDHLSEMNPKLNDMSVLFRVKKDGISVAEEFSEEEEEEPAKESQAI